MKFNRHILAQEYFFQVYFSGVLCFEKVLLSFKHRPNKPEKGFADTHTFI